MSVINKVLRDLDRRQSGRRTSGFAAGASAVQQDGVSVPAGVAGRRALWLLLLLAALALAGYLGWRASAKGIGAPQAIPATALPAAPAAPVSASVPVPVPVPQAVSSQSQPASALPRVASSALASIRIPDVAALPVQTAPAETAKSVKSADAAMATRSAHAVKSASVVKSTDAALVHPPVAVTKVKPVESSEPPMRAVPVPTAPPSTQRAPRASAPVTATDRAGNSDALPVPKPMPQLAQEALAQAQAQWRQGDHAGAFELVRGTVARLEGSPGGDSAVLASAAREYVRMALAQERTADALALLVRLEPRLAKVADIWALRGNAAQRLGLHAQAVHAYLNALDLQPGQARWMLATAVSLAAQGQTTPAAEFADKARRAGFLPPDVANYLKQLGVVLQRP